MTEVSDEDEARFYRPQAWSHRQLVSFARQLVGSTSGSSGPSKSSATLVSRRSSRARGGKGHAFPAATVRFGGGISVGWKALSICLDYSFPVRSLRRYWNVAPAGQLTGRLSEEIVFREMP